MYPKIRTRLRLLGLFGLGSLVPVVALGGLLAAHERNSVRAQEEASTAEFAKVTARGVLSFILSPSDLAGPLPPGRVAILDQVVAGLSDPGSTPHVWLRAPGGTVRYSDEHFLIGTRPFIDHAFRQAIGGQTVAVHTSVAFGRDHVAHDVLAVDIPNRAISPSAPPGVVQVFMPYNPIASTVAHDFRRSGLYIGGGLAALWLVLLPLVLSVARRLEHQVRHNEFLALHDTLTGLPNRALLADRVERVAIRCRRHGSLAALVLLDLDRFKEVNDTLGHHQGDALLQQVAERLTGGMRAADTVARLGGDEFVVLLTDIESAPGALQAAERIETLLAEPFVVGEVRIESDVSIGIAVCPDHGENFEDLLQRADIAMYAAKGTHAGPMLYSDALDIHSPDRLALLGDLRRAIEAGELVLHFQPKVDLRSGRVEGAEALLRWNHPTHGLVPPGEFIPLAERTGLIRSLTTWVLGAALRQCRAWRDEGLVLPVAVNVSARSLLDPALPQLVGDLLSAYDLDPGMLDIEITETAIMADPARATEIVTALAEHGVRISIDDFGVGYTSMAHLKRLPVHELKIDQSFVSHMTENQSDAVIVRSTVDLGRNLGLRIVAEGVETSAVSEQLQSIGCDLAQGYHYARPMPAEMIPDWIRKRAADLIGSLVK